MMWPASSCGVRLSYEELRVCRYCFHVFFRQIEIVACVETVKLLAGRRCLLPDVECTALRDV